MSGKDKGKHISPVRARLKKRRRPQKGGGGEVAHCALQNLVPIAPISSKPQSRHCGVEGAEDGHGSKENVLNGQHVVSMGASVGEKSGEPSAGERRGLGGAVTQHDNALHCSDPQLHDGNDQTDCKSPSKKLDSCTDASTLAFMDDMEIPTLMAAIPSMLGLDMKRYDTSSSNYQRALERAFDYTANDKSSRINQQDTMRNSHNRLGIYHPLVGRIDPHAPDEVDVHSIAFPRSKAPCSNPTRTDGCNDLLFGHLDLHWRTGHGMCIPASWYQFPCQATNSSPLPEKVANDLGDDHMHPVLENDASQSVQRNDESQPARKPPIPADSVIEQIAYEAPVHESEVASCVEGIQPTREFEAPHNYLGKIHIQSDRGATIREVFDIDTSNFVVGKLRQGDERYFLEKRTLPPPPISLVDDSDEESEDECVAVVRYKIVLLSEDYSESGQFTEDASGHKIGWISDRGRLADEPYLILREI